MPPTPGLFKEQLSPQSVFQTVRTESCLTNAEGFHAVLLVFSSPYPTVVTVSMFRQVPLCFVLNRVSNTRNPPCENTSFCRLQNDRSLAATRTAARQWTCAERLGKCW
jgi:hypothetical protein